MIHPRPARLLVAATAVLIVAGCTVRPSPVWAAWPVAATADTASGTAAAGSLAQVAQPSAHCQSYLLAMVIVVNWSAVPHATGYNIYSAGGGNLLGQTSGNTATSWQSQPLLIGVANSYQVAATVGTYWAGQESSATTPLTAVAGLACI